MKCKKCNAHIEVGSTICPGCGIPVEQLQNTGNLENDGNVQQPQMNSVPANNSQGGVQSSVGNSQMGTNPENVVLVNQPTMENQVNASAGGSNLTENPQGNQIPQSQINSLNGNGMGSQTPNANPQVEENSFLTNQQVPVNPIPLNNEENVNSDGLQSISATNRKPFGKIDFKQQKGIFICIGAIIFIAIIGFCILKFFKAGPKDIFNKSIDNVFNLAINNFENYDKPFSSSINIKPKVELNDSNYAEIAQMINKLDLGFHYGFDRNKKIMNFELKSSYDNGSLLNANMYFGNKKALLYLPGIYDKYIDSEIEEKDFEALFEEKNVEEMKTILNEIKSAYKKSLKSEYFETDHEEVVIDGSEVKVKKSTLKIDAKMAEEFQKAFFNELSESDDFIKAVSKISNESKADIKKEIQEMAKESLDTSSGNAMSLSIYTKGLLNDFVGIKIESNGSVFNVIKQKKDEYAYEIKSDGSTIVSGSVVTKQDGNKQDAILALKVPNFGKLELQMTTNTEYDKKLEVPSVSSYNIISSKQMTQQDFTKIQNALMQNEGIKKLMQELQPLMQYSSSSNYGSDYDDDYNYGYDDYNYEY